MFRFLIVFFLLLAVSCKNTQYVTSEQVIFEQKKTPCFGTCPVYELKIYDNRTAEIMASQNLDIKGHYLSKIPEERFEALKKAFDESNFFKYKDQYTSNITDLPTTYITYRKGEKEKTIQDYHGAPVSLKELEKMLHNLVLELSWEEVKN